MTKKRVVVTGMGALTPIGQDVKTYWDSLKEGKSGVGKIMRFDVSEYTTQIAAELKDFDPKEHSISKKKAKRMDDFIIFALAAANEAVKNSGIDTDKENPFRCSTIIGSGTGGLNTIEREHKKLLKRGPRRVSPFLIPAMIMDMSAGEVAIKFGLKGPNYGVVSACASGAHAIGNSMRLIQNGEVDIAVTGGTENSISPLGLAGFCSLKALSTRNGEPQKASRPFDAERDGFVMGEGAGMVVLEELEHAKARGAKIYAELAGYGATADAYHITAPQPEGESGTAAMKAAVTDAELNPEDIDYINAHGTSTPLNDKIETMVIKNVFGEHAKKIAISSTKSMAGHLLGAAGAIEFIACIKTITDGVAHPTINYENPDPECDLDYVPNQARDMEVNAALTNSLGFGGHNAALVVKKYSG
ncbi:MAG: beta-ketoacyl-ACP synthase II [Elusimicrobia bacterium]|jgi:3-oxoacyl-[acyl-carrier-protein] synthase II|nr:beta-ketoacyl-ACP synthase II [Elusimicrobiota bacterium]